MSSPAEQHQERIQLGLLEFLNRHAIDDDYERLRSEGRQSRRTPQLVIALLVTAAVFALLVVTAAGQTTRNAGADEKDRQELIGQITERKATIAERRSTIRTLTQQNKVLNQQFLTSNPSGSELFRQLSNLSTWAGATAVTGQGVRVVVDDAPDSTSSRTRVLDTDLQKLVNGLWQAGAEAISINGQRITTLTAIREASQAITVNYRSLRGPYTVLAIGDRNEMPGRFAATVSGATWFDLHKQLGLVFSMTPEKKVTIPAAPPATLSHAKPLKLP